MAGRQFPPACHSSTILGRHNFPFRMESMPRDPYTHTSTLPTAPHHLHTIPCKILLHSPTMKSTIFLFIAALFTTSSHASPQFQSVGNITTLAQPCGCPTACPSQDAVTCLNTEHTCPLKTECEFANPCGGIAQTCNGTQVLAVCVPKVVGCSAIKNF